MSEKVLKGYADVIGKHALVISDHTGPASYTTGGETLGRSSAPYKPFLGLRTVDMLLCNDLTISGNYLVQSQSVVGGGGSSAYGKLKWLYGAGGGGSGVQSVTITAAGTYTGTTPSVTFAAAPAGGTTATGIAILNGAGTAVIGVLITNPGAGYLTAPAVTFGAGGANGTAVLNASGAAGTEVASGTNLSGETVRITAIGG